MKGHATKITFEDHGQDFLEWYVRDGEVIDCQPFQGYVWVGTKVLNTPTIGETLVISTRHGTEGSLPYPVANVETVDSDEDDNLDSIHKGWLEMIGRMEGAA